MTNSDAPDPGQLAAMVQLAEAGDAEAKDALFATLYNELHRLAESHIREAAVSSPWVPRRSCTKPT